MTAATVCLNFNPIGCRLPSRQIRTPAGVTAIRQHSCVQYPTNSSHKRNVLSRKWLGLITKGLIVEKLCVGTMQEVATQTIYTRIQSFSSNLPQMSSLTTTDSGDLVVKSDERYDKSALQQEGWRFDVGYSPWIGKTVSLPMLKGIDDCDVMVEGNIVATLPPNYNDGYELFLWEDCFLKSDPLCINHIDLGIGVKQRSDEKSLLSECEQLLRCIYGFLESQPIVLYHGDCIFGIFQNAIEAAKAFDQTVSWIIAQLNLPEKDNIARGAIIFRLASQLGLEREMFSVVVDKAVLRYMISIPSDSGFINTCHFLHYARHDILCIAESDFIIAGIDNPEYLASYLDVPHSVVAKMMYELSLGQIFMHGGLKFTFSTKNAHGTRLNVPIIALKAILSHNRSPVMCRRTLLKDLVEKGQMDVPKSLLDLGSVMCLSLDNIVISRFPTMACVKTLFPMINLSMLLACCNGFLQFHGGFKWRKYSDHLQKDFRVTPIFSNRYVGQYFPNGRITIDFDEFIEVAESASRGGRSSRNAQCDSGSVDILSICRKLEKEGWYVGSEENEYMRIRVRRFFRSYGFSDATVVGFMPAKSNDGIALWHLVHDDADEEDVELLQLLHACFNIHGSTPGHCWMRWRDISHVEINLNYCFADDETVLPLLADSNELCGLTSMLSKEIPLRFSNSCSLSLRLLLLLGHFLMFFRDGGFTVYRILSMFEILKLRYNQDFSISPHTVVDFLKYLCVANVCKTVTGFYSSYWDIVYEMTSLELSDHDLSGRTVYIEAYRSRGDQNNLFFLSVDDICSSLKLDHKEVMNILHGLKQSTAGYCFRFTRLDLSDSYFINRHVLISEFLKQADLKKYTRSQRSIEMLGLSFPPSAHDRQYYQNMMDVESSNQDSIIRIGPRHQAMIPPFMELPIANVDGSSGRVIKFCDTTLFKNEHALFDDAMKYLLLLGKLVYARAGLIIPIKSETNSTTPVCILQDFTAALNFLDWNNMEFSKLKDIVQHYFGLPLKVFDGDTMGLIYWTDVMMTSADDDVEHLILESNGSIADIYREILDASEARRVKQWTIDELTLLEPKLGKGIFKPITDDLLLLFRRSKYVDGKRTFKDLVSLYYEYPFIFKAEENDFGGESTDVVCMDPELLKDRIQRLLRVFRCASYLKQCFQKDLISPSFQLLENAIMHSFASESNEFHSPSPGDMENRDLRIDLSVTDSPVQRTEKSDRPDSNDGKDRIESVTHLQKRQRMDCTDSNVASAVGVQWMRQKKDQRIVIHDNESNIISNHQSSESRVENMSGTPFPYHFVILEALTSADRESMDFDEVLRRTQSSYCVSLYSRNHMLRSLDRLITVGDICQVGSGERKTLSITATGKERYYKKKDDYDNSGLCSQWLRAQKLITKYCMHDMIAAIFKLRIDPITVKDIATYMIKCHNYPNDVYQIEVNCLIPMIKMVLSALESQGLINQTVSPVGQVFELNEEKWGKQFICLFNK